MAQEAEDEEEDEDEPGVTDPTQDHSKGTQNQISKSPTPKRTRYQRAGPQFLPNFATPLSSDFTRSLRVLLVIEVEGVDDHTSTGGSKWSPSETNRHSDENFVIKTLISRYSVDQSKIRDLPAEK